MTLFRSILHVCAVAITLAVTAPVSAADDDVRWTVIPSDERQAQWSADGLAATSHMAEMFTAPLGYRIERYFWRAQKPAGAFAIAVMRDLTMDEHYLSGPVDLIKFATTVLKGLEAPGPKPLDEADQVLKTASGPAFARRFEFGARQCLALGLYGAPNGEAAKGEAPLTEGSLRLDGVYCASAGEQMTETRARAVATALRLGAAEEPVSEAEKKPAKTTK